jgi:hypothetical protein
MAKGINTRFWRKAFGVSRWSFLFGKGDDFAE